MERRYWLPFGRGTEYLDGVFRRLERCKVPYEKEGAYCSIVPEEHLAAVICAIKRIGEVPMGVGTMLRLFRIEKGKQELLAMYGTDLSLEEEPKELENGPQDWSW